MARRLLLLIGIIGLFAAPGTARAGVPLAHCGQTVGLQCGTVDVPLDRNGGAATIGLHVEVLPASGRTTRGVMYLIAGGPGQGSATVFDLGTPDNADLFQAIFPGYTLVAVDNRGTGKSGLINCPALQTATDGTAEEFAALARDCAVAIGSQRVFYSTHEHAEDLESVRTALGFGKIALYGVSYGTKLSLAYALAHPSSVDRLVLDSVVPPEDPDPFDRNVLQEMPKTLAAFCSGGTCRGATANYAGEVTTLANRLEARPITGTVLAPGGGTKTEHMNGEDLVSLVIDSDLNPGISVELPAAVHAALGGYTRPLLRLLNLDRLESLSATDLSFGLNAATNCADGRFPWSPDTQASARQSAIDAAVAAMPASAFGPFGTWASRTGMAYFCEQWPTPSGRTPLGPGPLPNVPVLLISGGYDLRTPTANAVEVAQQFPQSHLLVVPGIGHSVLSGLSGCALTSTRDWLLGNNIPSACPRVPPLVKVVGQFAKRATRSTTLALARRSVHDAAATWLDTLFASTRITPPGLYGGTLSQLSSQLGFTVKKYSLAPGIAITGKLVGNARTFPITFTGTIRVAGSSAQAGTLKVTPKKISGTLGGRKVSTGY